MMMVLYCLLVSLTTFLLVPVQTLSQNNTAVLISTYSKVAHWGAVKQQPISNLSANPNEGRSNSGQTLWTHRSDVNVIGGQNLKKKPSVTYLYNVQKPSSKTDKTQQETLPAKGEIQERFNPRPYFEYSPYAKLHKTQSNQPSFINSQPSVVYATPFTKYPVFNKPQEASKPADMDLYNSPFNSYNPPDPKPDNLNDNFPPNAGTDDGSPPSGSYLPPPTAAVPPPTTSNSYSSPDESYDQSDLSNTDDSYQDSYKYPNKMSPSDDDNKNDFHGPYVYSPPAEPSLETDSKPMKSYLPPSKHHEVDDNDGPPLTKIVEPSEPSSGKHTYLEQPPDGWNDDDTKTQSMAEDDLSPPPPSNHGKLPEYLDHDPNKAHGYDLYNLDHHTVYHEVHHTTEQPEDMRVNKGHYSYYYLGRKLWYIPLYFSIYFIIYVTVLILKSIARHKIDFKNKHYHDKHRQARKMDINDIQVQVGRAIENATEKYAFM